MTRAWLLADTFNRQELWVLRLEPWILDRKGFLLLDGTATDAVRVKKCLFYERKRKTIVE